VRPNLFDKLSQLRRRLLLYLRRERFNRELEDEILVSSSQDETMKVWDLKSGALLRTIDVGSDGIWGIQTMSFSPDGKRLITAGENGSLRVWDASLWKVV
jgi:WD40 repeat protein